MSLPEPYERDADAPKVLHSLINCNGLDRFEVTLENRPAPEESILHTDSWVTNYKGKEFTGVELQIGNYYHGQGEERMEMLKVSARKKTGGGKGYSFLQYVPLFAVKKLIEEYEQEVHAKKEAKEKAEAPKTVEELLQKSSHRVEIEYNDMTLYVNASGHHLDDILNNATSGNPKVYSIDGIEIKNRDIPYLIESGQLHAGNTEIKDGELVIKQENLCSICNRFMKDREVEEAKNAGISPLICRDCNAYMQGAPEEDCNVISVRAVKAMRKKQQEQPAQDQGKNEERV